MGDTVQSDEPVANLYFAALISTGCSLVMLAQMKNKRNRFFWLPLCSLFCSNVYIWIGLNYCIQMIRESDIPILTTVQLVFDYITSICLGWAYAFRLRLIVFSGIAGGALHPALGPLCLCFFVIPAIYFIADVCGIVSVWVPALRNAAGGKFDQYNFGAWNIALILNDLFMHFAFCYFLLKQISSVMRKEKVRRLIFVAVCLASNSLAHLAGCIYNFFNPEVGTIWLYTFWVNNVLVFLLLNKTIASTLKNTRSHTSATTPSRQNEIELGGQTYNPDRDQ